MERRLVELAMRGDEEAFDILVGQIGDSLHSVARRIHHAWVWKHNPGGMFADWNPEVTCP